MWEFIVFFRNCIVSITDMLDGVVFKFGAMNVSLFDLFFGFIALGIIISVFWKGSRA